MRLTPKPSSIPVYTGIELPLNDDYSDWDHTPSLSDYANDVFTVIMPIMIFTVIMLMNMCVMKVFLSDFQANCFFFYGSFRQLSWYLGKDHKEIYTKIYKTYLIESSKTHWLPILSLLLQNPSRYHPDRGNIKENTIKTIFSY